MLLKELWDVHLKLPLPTSSSELVCLASDVYFAHYGQNGVDDRGYGCGYRSLQTLAAWIARQKALDVDHVVPDLASIQAELVKMDDKPNAFMGSKEWIGCVETALVLDALLATPCKVLHVPQGELRDRAVPVLTEHFTCLGSPVQMGGNVDAMSKAICGMAIDADDVHLLILDPHYFRGVLHNESSETDIDELLKQRWIRWSNINSNEDFRQDSFYNLCMPQLKSSVPM